MFNPLPYDASDMVFHALPLSLASRKEVEDLTAADGLLEQWFPVDSERAWALRAFGRALCPQDSCKSAIVHVDTLGSSAGNRGKTALQFMLQCVLGPGLCNLSPRNALSLGRSAAYMDR
jgi:hypothetical protein